jgi:hypothetical protein
MTTLSLRAAASPIVLFTDNELDVLSELLAVSQRTLLNLADTHERTCGHSHVADRLRQHAESAADLRDKIEAR